MCIFLSSNDMFNNSMLKLIDKREGSSVHDIYEASMTESAMSSMSESFDEVNNLNDPSKCLRSIRTGHPDKIVIAQLNTNSIRNKFEQFKCIVKGNVDILVLLETKLDSTFTSAQFMIDGFSAPYRLDRDKNGGGIIVLIREDILSRLLQEHMLPEDIEALPIEINLRKSKFLLLATYHPPSQSKMYYFDHITKIMDKYAKYEKVLLA